MASLFRVEKTQNFLANLDRLMLRVDDASLILLPLTFTYRFHVTLCLLRRCGFSYIVAILFAILRNPFLVYKIINASENRMKNCIAKINL